MTTTYVKKPREYLAAQLTAPNDTGALVDLGCALSNSQLGVLLITDEGSTPIPLNGWVSREANVIGTPEFHVWTDEEFRSRFEARG